MLSFGMHILTSLGACAKEVQFYWPSRTYPAIPYCTIFPFLELQWHSCIIWCVKFVSKKIERYSKRKGLPTHSEERWSHLICQSCQFLCSTSYIFFANVKKRCWKKSIDLTNLICCEKRNLKPKTIFLAASTNFFSTLQHLVCLEKL